MGDRCVPDSSGCRQGWVIYTLMIASVGTYQAFSAGFPDYQECLLNDKAGSDPINNRNLVSSAALMITYAKDPIASDYWPLNRRRQVKYLTMA